MGHLPGRKNEINQPCHPGSEFRIHSQRDMFEAKVPFVSKVVWRFRLLHEDDVFDSDPVATICVVARLVRDGHTRLQRGLMES